MSVYAQVRNDTIVNIVQCDAAFAAKFGLTKIDNFDPIPGIGWTLTGGVWSPPVVVVTSEQQNQQTLQQRAVSALTNNATFLAIGSPSSAQAVAQVQALTRQLNGVIRMLLSQLDTIADS